MIPMSLKDAAFFYTVYPGVTAEHLIQLAEKRARHINPEGTPDE